MPFPSEPFTSNKWLSLFTALDIKVSHPDPAQVCEGCHELQRLLLTRMSIVVILEEKELLSHIIVALEQTIHRIFSYTEYVIDVHRNVANAALRDNMSRHKESCFELLDTLTLIIEQCLSLYLSSNDTKDVYYRLLVRGQIVSITSKLFTLWSHIAGKKEQYSLNTQQSLFDAVSNDNNKVNNTTHMNYNHEMYIDGKICYLLINLLLSSPFCDALAIEEHENEMQNTEGDHKNVWQSCSAYEQELWQEVKQIQECIDTHPSLLVRKHILQRYQNSMECTPIVQEIRKYYDEELLNSNTSGNSQAYNNEEHLWQNQEWVHKAHILNNCHSTENNEIKYKGLAVKYAITRLFLICNEVQESGEEKKKGDDVIEGEDGNSSDVNTTETKACNYGDDDANRREDRTEHISNSSKIKNVVDYLFTALATCNSHGEMLCAINELWYLSASDEKAVAHFFSHKHLHQMKRFICTLPRTDADVRVFMELFKWLIAFIRYNTLCNTSKTTAINVEEVLVYTCLESLLKLLCVQFHLVSNTAKLMSVNTAEIQETHEQQEEPSEKQKEMEEKNVIKNNVKLSDNGATEFTSSTLNITQHKDEKNMWDDQRKSGLLSFILSFLQCNSRWNASDTLETPRENKTSRQEKLLNLFDGKVMASLVEILQCAAQTREVQIFLPTTRSGSDYSNSYHNSNNLSEEVYMQSTLRSIANSITINATFACKIVQILMNMYTNQVKELWECQEMYDDMSNSNDVENLSEAAKNENQRLNDNENVSSQTETIVNNSWRLTLMPFLQLIIPLLMEIALRYPTLSVNYEHDYMEFVNGAPIASTLSSGRSSATTLYEQTAHTYAFCYCTIAQSALEALVSCLEVDATCHLQSINWEAILPLLKALFECTQTSTIASVKSVPYTISSLLCNGRINTVLSLEKEWPELLDHALNEIVIACQQTENASNKKWPEQFMKTQMASVSAAAEFICTISQTISEHHQQNNPFVSSSDHAEMSTLRRLAQKLISVKAKVLSSLSSYKNIVFIKNTWATTMSVNKKIPNASNCLLFKPMSGLNAMTAAFVQLCAVLTKLECSNHVNNSNIINENNNNDRSETSTNGNLNEELIKEQLSWLPQWQTLVTIASRNNWLLAQASHAVLSNPVTSNSTSATHNMCSTKNTTHGANKESKTYANSSLECNNNIARALHSINKILLQYQYTTIIAEILNYLLSMMHTLERIENEKKNKEQRELQSDVANYDDYATMVARYFTPSLLSEFATNIFALPSPQQIMHIIKSRFNVYQEILPARVERALRTVYNSMIHTICTLYQAYPVELLVNKVKLPKNMFTELCSRLQDTSIDLRARSQIAGFANRLILCVKTAFFTSVQTSKSRTLRKKGESDEDYYEYLENYKNNDTYKDDDDDNYDSSRCILKNNICILDKFSLPLFIASIASCTLPSFSTSLSRSEELIFAELEENGICALQCSLLHYFAAPNAFAAKSSWLAQCIEELYNLIQDERKNNHNSAFLKANMQHYYSSKTNGNSVISRLTYAGDVHTSNKSNTPSREQFLLTCKQLKWATYLSIISNYFANTQCNVLQNTSMHQIADILCTGSQCTGAIQMMTLDAIKNVMQSEIGQVCLLMEASSTLQQQSQVKNSCKLRTCFDLLLTMLLRSTKSSSTSQITSSMNSKKKRTSNNNKFIEVDLISSCFDICTFLCGKSTNSAFVSAFIKHKCLHMMLRELEQHYTNREVYSIGSGDNNYNNSIIEKWWRLLAAVSLHIEGQVELMRTTELFTIVVETSSNVNLIGTLALLILRNVTFHDSYKAVLCQDARVLLTLKAVLLCIPINELLCRLYSNVELMVEVDNMNNINGSNTTDKKQTSGNSAISTTTATNRSNYITDCTNRDRSNMWKDTMTSIKFNNSAKTMSTLQYNLCMFCKRLNLSSSALIEWAEQVTKRDAEQRKNDESVVGVYAERRQELAASALLSLTYYHDRDKFYVKQVMEQEPRVDIDTLISAQTNRSEERKSAHQS